VDIRVDGLTKIFTKARTPPFVALDDVDLACGGGEIVALVGPSGCGKTTLLNVIAGLTEPTSGHVTVDGVAVTGPGPERGVIFQQYALFPWMTVRENVEFGLRLRGVRRSQLRGVVDHYLELVGLGDFPDTLPKELSGGMKQRCAIARAYAVQPVVMLMDEPFGALDAMTRVTLQEQLLDTWGQERTTIMFITHDVDEAVYLARRVVVMASNPGRITKIIDVDLPYPRTQETRLSEAFVASRATVWREVWRPMVGGEGL